MSKSAAEIKSQSRELLSAWLESCRRHDKIARNTIAIGLVVIDHFRANTTLTRDMVLSGGGEIRGARSSLGRILEKYGIDKKFLKEITTRQAHQDGQRLIEAFEWGNLFSQLSSEDKDEILIELAEILCDQANEWLNRRNLNLIIDRRQSPTTWVKMIIDSAKSKSGGVVEQHLVGAKLERRFENITIPNLPAHAADIQTAREGDFSIKHVIYHVTASPGRSVIQKCAVNLRSGKYPILIVPSDQENKAKAIADDEGIGQSITIISIEDFVALNIIELALEENKDQFYVLQEIIDVYNKRLKEVETDLSLQIEIN